MKIFRAIQISLKEFRRPNKLTRFISSQCSDVTTGISPCEYKVKSKIKSKDKSKASKLSKFMKSIRKFSAPGSLKESYLKATPHSGFVYNEPKNNLHCPLLITTRRNSSYQSDTIVANQKSEFHGETIDKELPANIVNLLEVAQGFAKCNGTDTEGCSQKEASALTGSKTEECYQLVSMRSKISPRTLDVLNPKIMSKLIVEEMLRLVSSSKLKPNLIEGENGDNSIAKGSSDVEENGNETRNRFSVNFYLSEIVKTLQSLSFLSKDNSCDGKLVRSSFKVHDSEGKSSSMRPILQISSKPNSVPCCQYHTIKTIILPKRALPCSSSCCFFHTSQELQSDMKTSNDKWFMQSKKISNTESDLMKGSGDSFVEPGQTINTNFKYEEPTDMSAFRPANRELPQTEIFHDKQDFQHASVMNNANSFASSEDQQTSDSASNRTLYSGASNMGDTFSMEEGNFSRKQYEHDENLTFRSTLSPEFIRPNISSYDIQFEEDTAPHVAMLSTFCAPLPPELQRENIIPIQIVEEEQIINNRLNMSKPSEESQGLLKSVLDKINLLKWN